MNNIWPIYASKNFPLVLYDIFNQLNNMNQSACFRMMR